MSAPIESDVYERSAEWLKARFTAASGIYPGSVEKPTISPKTELMTDVTRHEMNAALAASEAKVATAVESMRADMAELRAELREGNSQIKAQGEIAKANAAAFQADADRFYADARTLLAESRTALTEIRLAGERNKVNVMGIGYKFLTWFFGAIVALGGLYFTIKKAIAPPNFVATEQAASPSAAQESTRPAAPPQNPTAPTTPPKQP